MQGRAWPCTFPDCGLRHDAAGLPLLATSPVLCHLFIMQGRASLCTFLIEGCDMMQLAAELDRRHIAVRWVCSWCEPCCRVAAGPACWFGHASPAADWSLECRWLSNCRRHARSASGTRLAPPHRTPQCWLPPCQAATHRLLQGEAASDLFLPDGSSSRGSVSAVPARTILQQAPAAVGCQALRWTASCSVLWVQVH